MFVKGSSAKRHRQNQKRRLRNRMVKSAVKSSTKKYLVSVQENNKEKAEADFKLFVQKMDSAVSKGVYHKNTAARKKSRMHQLLNKMGS